MIQALIIDDEALARNIVRAYLKQHPQVEVVAECSNGYEALKAIQQFKPGLLFLDIQMPKISGLELLEILDEKPAVIFTTAYDEYALQAFERNAVDYLLKPFSQQRFDAAMSRWQQHTQTNTGLPEQLLHDAKHPDSAKRIVVRVGTEIRILSGTDIHYLEAKDDYVKIFTGDKSYLKKNTLQHFENTLNGDQFFRVHRSYMINLSELTGIEPYEKNSYQAVLKNGNRIPVSRSGYMRLREKLGM